ncbi:MAG TPA: deoxyribonuclease IV [Silvibacterium sp.]|nr:deoxyribonuclease IV [Silvibacterium sp.]
MSTPRIGIHLSTSGGVFKAAERAHEIGANTFQIFSSSPRMWRPTQIDPAHIRELHRLREQHGIAPTVIHTSYLVNLCSQTEVVRCKSVDCFRAEVQRAIALRAEYLVLHPGSWRGLSRQEGLALAAESIEDATQGIDLDAGGLQILIENTAGAEFSLGGSFEQVGELVEQLRPVIPVGSCLDTCHCHVAGYDLVSSDGYEAMLRLIDTTIGIENVHVWHMNDAKAARGSKLDRHEHIGRGTIGIEPFRRLLNDSRFAHCAFIAETPVDEPGDDARNVRTMLGLVDSPAREGSIRKSQGAPQP